MNLIVPVAKAIVLFVVVIAEIVAQADVQEIAVDAKVVAQAVQAAVLDALALVQKAVLATVIMLAQGLVHKAVLRDAQRDAPDNAITAVKMKKSIAFMQD